MHFWEDSFYKIVNLTEGYLSFIRLPDSLCPTEIELQSTGL